MSSSRCGKGCQGPDYIAMPLQPKKAADGKVYSRNLQTVVVRAAREGKQKQTGKIAAGDTGKQSIYSSLYRFSLLITLRSPQIDLVTILQGRACNVCQCSAEHIEFQSLMGPATSTEHTPKRADKKSYLGRARWLVRSPRVSCAICPPNVSIP